MPRHYVQYQIVCQQRLHRRCDCGRVDFDGSRCAFNLLQDAVELRAAPAGDDDGRL